MAMRLDIKSIRPLEAPPTEVPVSWRKEKPYPSPDGKRIVWAESLGDFAMGCEHYALRLGGSTTAFQDTIELRVPGKEKSRIDCPDHYQPWSFDSRSLLICLYGSPPILLDLDNRKARELRIDKGPLVNALCSPTRPVVFLAPRAEGASACFVPLEGDLSPSVTVSGPTLYSYAIWLGEHLLFLQQQPLERRAALKLLDPNCSQPVAEADASPERLLPYDSSPIRRLKISGFRSITEPVRWGPGFPYLDVWTACHYVASRQGLVMKVGRPAGGPEKRSWLLPRYEIPIRFVWVEVGLQVQG